MADTSAVENSEAYTKVQDDNDPTNWILVDQEKNNTVSVLASGNGGYDEMIQYLDATKAQYGFFRVVAIDQSSEITSKRPKFVFFSWIGPNVSIMTRAKVSGTINCVRKLFNRAHIEFQISSVEEMTKDIICDALTKCAGAHAPDSYIFDNQDLNNSVLFETESNIQTDTTTFESTWEEFKETENINWILMSVDKADQITIFAKGNQGLNELRSLLPNDQVVYGVVKVIAISTTGSVESRRERYVMFAWVPSGASIFCRTRVGTQKNTILKKLEIYHAEMRADSLDDLSEEAIIELLNRSTGSHKPDRYEF
ncbi:hypothetical protein WA158_001088 [Blastocystis sp. Blastoise]